MGMGWVVYFSKNFRKLAAFTLCRGMFDETIIFQRSLENSYALPNIDELLCDFSNSNRCLLSAANSLFTQLLCLAVLQCCSTVKRFSAMTFTWHNLQNKIFLSVVKIFFTKIFNKTVQSHTIRTLYFRHLESWSCTEVLTTQSGLCCTSKHPLIWLLSLHHIPSKNCYLWPLFLRTESQIKFLANNCNIYKLWFYEWYIVKC